MIKAPALQSGAFHPGADDGNRTRDIRLYLGGATWLSLGEGGSGAMVKAPALRSGAFHPGADDGNRTRDLRLTKAVLYRLSHISICTITRATIYDI